MFARFSKPARAIMEAAQHEARQYGHEYLGTEHILLGFTGPIEGASNLLTYVGVSPSRVRLELEQIGIDGDGLGSLGRLPQTPRAKRVIEFAIEEAERSASQIVYTPHLFVALLRESQGVAAHVLNRLGLDLETARRELLKMSG
jgi:ATP-dependent Clp protease ATP-binding subunit ClpC